MSDPFKLQTLDKNVKKKGYNVVYTI
ncbi:uncharacterized protein METZ01_LOCUS315840 [marine metagenome]|uniref:Uncharacterized protein n=1 Tax=marine metagenome TaxID=408172 RepID=A0A382NPF9_9ZZZZ